MENIFVCSLSVVTQVSVGQQKCPLKQELSSHIREILLTHFLFPTEDLDVII